MVFQWAVRVCQRLQSRSLQSGAFCRFGLVQIFLEASEIRGVSQTLGRQSLYMTGAVAACFDGYGDGHFSRTHRQHHIQNLELNLCYTLKKFLLCVRLPRHSMRPADVASTARSMSLGRWLFVACFSSVKNHNVSGPHRFPSVTTPRGTRKKKFRHTWGVGWLDFSQKPSFSSRKSICTTDRFVVLNFSQLFLAGKK